MRKFMLFVMVASTVTMTTGCAHKKRVKMLEEEITRCRQRKAELSDATHQQPGDVAIAAAEATIE